MKRHGAGYCGKIKAERKNRRTSGFKRAKRQSGAKRHNNRPGKQVSGAKRQNDRAAEQRSGKSAERQKFKLHGSAGQDDTTAERGKSAERLNEKAINRQKSKTAERGKTAKLQNDCTK